MATPVVAQQRQRGTGKESEVAVELVFGTVFRLQDGRVGRIELFTDFADAVEAAGGQVV